MPIIVELLNRLSKLLKALWLFLAGVVAVFLIYYLLTGAEQGIDVVIKSGEVLASGVLTVVSVFLWSFLVWYSSRTLSYIKQHKDDEIFSAKGGDTRRLYEKYCIPSRLYQHIPRLLAYNCFVSVQVAIFHLPTFSGASGALMLAAITAHNIFYFILTHWFESRPGSRARKVAALISGLIIAGYALYVLMLMIRAAADVNILTDPLRHTFWLSLMALWMFILQVIVVFLFVKRRQRIDRRRADPLLRQSQWLRSIGFNPAFNAAEAPYFRLLNITALIAVLLYVCAIFLMDFSMLMGPMAFALLALGVLVGFSNLVTLLSIRSSFNVMFVLLVLAFFFGQYRDPYTVRFMEGREGQQFSPRPTTRQFLEKWFNRRIATFASGDTTTNFPVYIVLSNGGASRAGRWTSSVLSNLQDTSYRRDTGDSFKEHILCIAGASGGTVGNCAFYSLLKASQQGGVPPDGFTPHANAFFETDFLTYTLGRLMGPDIFRHLSPFNIGVDNRADALEDVIGHGSRDELINGFFQQTFGEVMDTTGALPILFINTTQVDNGMPGVISTVRLENSPRQDVLALADSMSVRSGKGDLRFSSAAVLSSRFPYVSPAGKVFDRYYVDGGYFDNSGAGTVLELINELNRFLTDTSNAEIVTYRERFTFHIIHITNSEIVRRPSGDIHPLTNDLLSPVLTLAGMQGASTSIGDGILVNAFRQFNADTANAMIVYSLYDEAWDVEGNSGQYEEGYPMSWTLSEYQRRRMDIALQRANRNNLWKFGF